MDDRAEAIDILTRMSTNHFYGHREQEAFKLGAEALSAERRGRWERRGYHLHCSCCDWSADLATPHCPGCGAYLGGDA